MSDNINNNSSFDLLIRTFYQDDRTQFDIELNHLLDLSRSQDMRLCTEIILQAYKKNELNFLEELLDREVIYSGIPNLTTLHAASGYALSRLAQYLLDERKTDPNQTCTFVKNDQLSGITPLHFACGIGPENLVNETADTVKYLLSSGADVNLVTSRQDTALHWASKFSNEDVVRSLLEYKSNVNAINSLQYTPLCEACFYGNFEIVKILVEHGANVNGNQEDERSPVHLVCRGLLSEHNARRTTPLNESVIEKLEKRLEIVKYLYSHGASIDTFDHDGLTPFMYACSSGNYSLVKYLLDEHKTKDDTSTLRIINERSNTGETCLMYAIESGNLDIVTLLCNHGAKLDDQKSPSYVTAAAFYGHNEILEKIILLGLDINEFDQNDDGVIFNPIYACCHCGSVECLQLLLEAKAKIDWKTSQGTNPLHAACYSDKCSVKLVELLCQYGDFDINECTDSGETPLLMAIERNDYDLVDYLLRQGALPDRPNHDECYPIHLACFNGHANILYLLLAFNATIEQSNENYPHPLVITTYKRDLECSKLLIESPKCSDRMVREILIESIENGFDELISEILNLRPHLIPDELKDKMADTLLALEQLNIDSSA
ncbi:unnamed protein product [Rotaria socialis]|uniref:Ankyrin repeat protein n=1 Tax=Rotaria socialis TaxID=392032 RepID=A0A818MRV4_9BILA|nr:unnamed protein product [Rotaria socialis]CAF4474891.1 unnamed protein product [Rotaria socialis]